MGDLILITKRKCSPKLQPKITVGTYYLVIKESKLKSGAVTLSVAEFATMVQEGLKDPRAKINPKYIMQCNEERFEWKKKSQRELASKFNDFKTEFRKQQEEAEKAIFKDEFTEEERIRMSFYPYICAELAWHYALKALEIVKARRIESLKKISRQLQECRCNFMFELARKMGHEILESAQSKVTDLLHSRQMDFFIFYTTVQNEINRQHIGIQDDDIKTYAYMSILCYRCLQKIDEDNIVLIRKRLGFASAQDSFPYMPQLKDCMLQYTEALEVEHTLPIRTAVSILEKNIMNVNI